MSNCMAPHIDNELAMVLQGDKPLAILYKDKQPVQYEGAIKAYKSLHIVHVRLDVVAIAQDAQIIRSYIGLVSNRKSYTREQYQRCMGKLFGYENHDVENFIQSETGKTCNCIECGGELN